MTTMVHGVAHQPRKAGRCAGEARAKAFSLIELLTVIAILMLLMGIIVPVVGNVRRSQHSLQCITNLRGIAAALQVYAMDNRTRMPDPGSSNKSWEQMVVIGAQCSFRCPNDCEMYPSVGSSYDWRDTGVESTTMAGRLMGDVTRPDAILLMESLPGWHQKDRINVARIDGSVQTIDQMECFKDLTIPIR